MEFLAYFPIINSVLCVLKLAVQCRDLAIVLILWPDWLVTTLRLESHFSVCLQQVKLCKCVLCLKKYDVITFSFYVETFIYLILVLCVTRKRLSVLNVGTGLPWDLRNVWSLSLGNSASYQWLWLPWVYFGPFPCAPTDATILASRLRAHSVTHISHKM